MRLIEVYKKIRDLQQPVVYTQDVVAALRVSANCASQWLTRLAAAHHLIPLRRGRWGMPERIEPLALPGYLTAPFPSYVSLQSALYYHGMISQIPSVIYAVSLARTRRFKTALGTVSLHHVQPSFFFGYTEWGKGDILMATPEKALLDILCFGAARSGLFRSLPELELPTRFSVKKARAMLSWVPAPRRRAMMMRRLESWVAGAAG